ncbi:MAG: F0F1 ATP synthase subunit A, partial [Caldilineaceae bacterium]|nr:F0F1 ATP synthase subunit A [Caldilineaceae bacterium]
MESVTNFYNRSKQKAQDNPRRTAIWVGLFILFVLSFLVPVDPPHVALSGEPIFSNGPKWFTNSILTTILVDIFLLLLAFLTTRNMKMIPGGLQNGFEVILEYLFNLSESVAGKDARRYFPWVTTIFLFVIFSNWSGLIPGVGSIGFYH